MKKHWINKNINELTVADAMEAQDDGINFVCGDGVLRQITTDTHTHILNLFTGKGGN